MIIQCTGTVTYLQHENPTKSDDFVGFSLYESFNYFLLVFFAAFTFTDFTVEYEE